MTPSEVKGCSMWEFDAAVAGWIAANTPDDKSISQEEEDNLWQGVVARM